VTLPAVTLMQPTLVAQPFHHKGWVYEEKVDGYRMVAQKDDGAVTIISRQGKDFTGRFPDLAKALASLPARSFILDGEVAVHDRAHISRFEWLRARPKDGRATLPVYMAFDVLELDGKDRTGARSHCGSGGRCLRSWSHGNGRSCPFGGSQATGSRPGHRPFTKAMRGS
jgi:ATP-dependent DNA ligase